MNQTADTAATSADWFPVEFSRNLLPGQVLQSTLLGHELALWRSASGAMSAVSYPHQTLPPNSLRCSALVARQV